MAENVRVVVRCRPMNEREFGLKCRNIIKINKCTLSVANPNENNAPEKEFTFDNVYSPDETTELLYNDVCYTLVDNVLEGYNGTIFAYGQTGCGKTHTMQGPDNFENISDIPMAERGVISRSFDHIFEAISVASGVRFLAFVSYLEIYNENIRDLLNAKEGVNTNHALKEQPGMGVTVPTLSTHTVLSAKECYQLLNMGNRNRMVGATMMNATSSRSHSIFTISLEQIVEDSDDGAIRRGKLNLVDLAGSERQNKTGAVGDRLKEATKINLSLSALGNVISALVDGKTKHIPYRDSKLTRLLQDSLGGNTKTLMISCISPADNNYDETLSTLRYASRAKNIANKPKINEDPKDAKLREYQEEILKLKQMLDASQTNMIAPSTALNVESAAVSEDWLEMERLKLKQEMDLQIQSLKDEHFQQQRAKDEQMREVTELRKHYEDQLRSLNAFDREPDQDNNKESLQFEARKRIEVIKRALIGGERAHDVQLKERRQKKKLDAQRRLSALAQALARVDQSEDRDILQGHYTDIQQELQAKNDYLKKYRQKVKALEREVSDLQSEFQLDRADYLDSIRRLERNLKFYQQLIDKALPILRKDGKYWDPDHILQSSTWNDDLKTWKLPQSTMNSFKLPLTNTGTIAKLTTRPEDNIEVIDIENGHNGSDSNSNETKSDDSTSEVHADILNNYFRSDRQKSRELMQQRKGFNNWKDYVNRRQGFQTSSRPLRNIRDHYDADADIDGNVNDKFEDYVDDEQNGFVTQQDEITRNYNRALSSWLRPKTNGVNSLLLNKTWTGINGTNFKMKKDLDNYRQHFLQPIEIANFSKKTIAMNEQNHERTKTKNL